MSVWSVVWGVLLGSLVCPAAAEPPPVYPEWFLVAGPSVEGTTDTGRPIGLPAGALVGLLAERGDRQQVRVLATGDVLWVPRDGLSRTDAWTATRGAPARVEGAEAPMPSVATGPNARVWVMRPDGHGEERVGTLIAPDAPARIDDWIVEPGAPIALACPDEPLRSAVPGPAPAPAPAAPDVALFAAGPAILRASAGDWARVELGGVAGWVPARCGARGALRAAHSVPLPDPAAPRARPLLLHFWATWCAPCVAEIDGFAGFAAAAPPGAVVAVSEDFRRDDALAFAGRRGVTAPIAFDVDGALLRRLGGGALPLTVVLSPTGEVVRRWEGPTDWADPALLALVAP